MTSLSELEHKYLGIVETKFCKLKNNRRVTAPLSWNKTGDSFDKHHHKTKLAIIKMCLDFM